MHSEKYQITLDATALRLVIVVSGLWDLVTVESYVAEMGKVLQAWRKTGHTSEELTALVDRRELALLSQDLWPTMREMIERHTSRVGQTAIVVSSMLSKFQAERLRPSTRIATFLDMDEAVRWLDRTE